MWIIWREDRYRNDCDAIDCACWQNDREYIAIASSGEEAIAFIKAYKKMYTVYENYQFGYNRVETVAEMGIL